MNNHLLEIQPLLDSQNPAALQNFLKNILPNDAADLIITQPPIQQRKVFSALSLDTEVSTFELLPFAIQKNILYAVPSSRAAQILNALSPDDRTAFLEELPSMVVKELLKLLSPSERKLTLQLLGYPEYSVGRLMTPDYIAVKLDWTVRQILDYVREFGHNSETIDVIYVVDDNNILIDDINLKEFLFASLDTTVANLSDRKYIRLLVTDNQENAINIFQKNNRVALPVTDAQGVLLGIVTIDDILNLSKQEDTEDIQKIGGMEALDEPYMQTPFFHLMKKRVGWLVILFIGEMFTATAMGFFQDEIAKAVVLALFIPLIISSGGNSGSQASTLIIRAMALGEVGLKDWWRIMRREIFAGLFLGTVLGLIGFSRVALWSLLGDFYGAHWVLIALTVCFSLVGVVLWGTLSGSMLPLFLRWIGVDPATSSAPFVATLVDVTGVIIYFSIAFIILRGTLL